MAREIPGSVVPLIKKYEGCSLIAYLDPEGIWTIGYGHTGTDVFRGLTIPQSKAEALLAQDIATTGALVEDLVTVPLMDNQFAALVVFTYNVGAGRLQSSTLLELLNAGQYDQVPAQLARWNKINGQPSAALARRRNSEIAMWNSSVA